MNYRDLSAMDQGFDTLSNTLLRNRMMKEQQAQRAAGIALVKEVNEAMRSKKAEYCAKPEIIWAARV